MSRQNRSIQIHEYRVIQRPDIPVLPGVFLCRNRRFHYGRRGTDHHTCHACSRDSCSFYHRYKSVRSVDRIRCCSLQIHEERQYSPAVSTYHPSLCNDRLLSRGKAESHSSGAVPADFYAGHGSGDRIVYIRKQEPGGGGSCQ